MNVNKYDELKLYLYYPLNSWVLSKLIANIPGVTDYFKEGELL